MSDDRFFAQAAALRKEFDRSFAQPPPGAAADHADLLAIRIGGDSYALLLENIQGIVARQKIVPVPSAAPHLLGLLGIRGGIVPVFGLPSIMGYESENGALPWIVLCGTEDPIALAFAEFEGYLRLAKSALHTAAASGRARQFAKAIASTNDGARIVIDLPSIVAIIKDRSGRQGLPKEQ